MKKLKVITLSIWVLLMFAIVSCNKETQQSTSGKISSTMKMNEGGNYNYCQGCGNNQSDQYYCKNKECTFGGAGGDENCPVGEIKKLEAQTGLASKISLMEAYDIRDNFLIKTEKGQWYITYYYELGNLAHSQKLININNLLDYIDFANKTKNIAQEIENGNPAAIPITMEYKNIAMKFINEYRNNTQDPTLLHYLSEIEQDLNNFTGQQVTYIRNEINN